MFTKFPRNCRNDRLTEAPREREILRSSILENNCAIILNMVTSKWIIITPSRKYIK